MPTTDDPPATLLAPRWPDPEPLPSLTETAGNPAPRAGTRVCARGKALFVGERKLTVKGVTYGPLAPRADGSEWNAATVDCDLRAMRAHGINAVRLYTVPPLWLLDLALEHGLFVLVGIPWEQHVAFLGDRRRTRSILRRVGDAVQACASHPALLGFAVGNEIPAPIVRWLGRRRVERFLDRCCWAVKRHDPGALVTYVNYPTTEYLNVCAADFVAFNVYLESAESFSAYIARLQNLADDRPLLLAELGLDSVRNGRVTQADSLGWQLRESAAAGVVGAFVFAWTDEWHRGGESIVDWDFGLTTRAREPKPALAAVQSAYQDPRPSLPDPAPSFSVVVCTYNGAATLAGCLEGVAALRYSDYELIVIDDGSTDDSAAIATERGARVIATPNRGLSAARNLGMREARGEIVAYLDDDARPDEDWLTFLAREFVDPRTSGAGGPNVLPPEAGAVARCVANAPGGPTQVLLGDRTAEHLPGCNLAVRRCALEAIGGFDEQFRVAGDDVDLCWRLLDAGGRLTFSPGAVVWHHRRASVRAYLAQQRGYGKAEALLERKWPERYSTGGHVGWTGRIYGNGSAQHRGGWRWRVYYGTWGREPFQSLYGPARGTLESLPLMPEWYLVILGLALVSAAGALARPLLVALPLLALATGALAFDAALGAVRARFPEVPSAGRRLSLRALTAILYLLQPLARLRGRLTHGLAPWRRRGVRGVSVPVPYTHLVWSVQWRPLEARLAAIGERIRAEGAVLVMAGPWDRWDLEVRGGALGGARLRATVEEHGAGRQLVRVRCWPRAVRTALLVPAVLVVLGVWCALLGNLAGGAVTIAVAAGIALRVFYECGVARAITRHAVLAGRDRDGTGLSAADAELSGETASDDPPRVDRAPGGSR